jgi:hypothetical protein
MILLFTLSLLLSSVANTDSITSTGSNYSTDYTVNTTAVVNTTMPTVLITGANRG